MDGLDPKGGGVPPFLWPDVSEERVRSDTFGPLFGPTLFFFRLRGPLLRQCASVTRTRPRPDFQDLSGSQFLCFLHKHSVAKLAFLSISQEVTKTSNLRKHNGSGLPPRSLIACAHRGPSQVAVPRFRFAWFGQLVCRVWIRFGLCWDELGCSWLGG